MPMPIPTPTGLERLKTTLDKMKFLRLRSDWAMLRPRLKAMTALWTITAMKIESRLPSSSCNPIAIPTQDENWLWIYVMNSIGPNKYENLQGVQKIGLFSKLGKICQKSYNLLSLLYFD